MGGAAKPIEPTPGPINPELQGYADQFEAAKAALAELTGGLTDEQFNWRPGEDQWSVGECMDHLVVLGGLMLPKLDEGIEKAQANGWKSDGPFKYGALGNWFLRMSGPDEDPPKRKLKAPKMYTPSSNHTVSRLTQGFNAMQDEFRARVEQATGLDLARVKVPSPVTRLIRLSLGQWFKLLAGHQERHLQQARRVKGRMET